MFIGFVDARYNRGGTTRGGMFDPGATLGLAALYLRTGDPAAWDAFESWHLCAETRVGAVRWAAAVLDAVQHASAYGTPGCSRRAAHVTDTLKGKNTRTLLRF